MVTVRLGILYCLTQIASILAAFFSAQGRGKTICLALSRPQSLLPCFVEQGRYREYMCTFMPVKSVSNFSIFIQINFEPAS